MQEENIQRCRTLSYNTRKLRTSVEMHAGREHTEMEDIALLYQEVKNKGSMQEMGTKSYNYTRKVSV